ncbi:hypothetical protein CYV26_10925 [Carnobacterium maltaromaticum]|uniref:hypothetical protein n=1 Tax=Carnobacterium maltaromaticum TaxID=2751 RepID=UPI000C78998D|nr:hypothetical protein [Carnobacterium maltaromaticum]PLS34018.1 hypothetical protein CYV30_12090 [Carnobacterium maltaromaticum]PLS34153.1 hypothetical protein CYV33_10910 [Carnobacterium maltaromaticum]PLS34289.1 hypothetical protein CYV31_12070 [Carnobacterium maltaromaticum]PLS41617.1 hypothetical protein CYV28_12025 [Carnobacterium maltaromaticum]PLS43099.1 hypothetical protein CYV27_10910 [Carnobacterium maltaromaticum]
MRQTNSIWIYILAAIGFIMVFGFLAAVFGAILFLIIKILIPIALVVWLINFISRQVNNRNRR